MAAKKQLSADSKQEKTNGVLRAQYVRQACYAWLERHKPVVLAKIRELSLKQYPKVNKAKSDFVLDKALVDLE